MTWRKSWPAIPATALLLLTVVLPVCGLLRISFYEGSGSSGFGIGGSSYYVPNTWSLDAYRWLGETYASEVIAFTLLTTLVCTAITMLIATPLAWWTSRLSSTASKLVIAAILLPKFANTLVLVFGLKLLVSASSPAVAFANLFGVLGASKTVSMTTATWIGEVVQLFPYPVILLFVAYISIPRSILEAAKGFGASQTQVFWQVAWPLTLPTFTLATALTATWSLGAFVSPYLLGGPAQFTLGVDLHRQAFENLNWPRAAAEAVVMIAAVTSVLAWARWQRGRA